MTGPHLALKFKGSRSYLHGTDLYAAVCQWSEQVNQEDWFVQRMVFRRIARKQCRLVTAKPATQETVIAEAILVNDKEQSTRIWLQETDCVVNERYPFMEELITQRADINVENKTITSTFYNQSTVLENVIALVKALNYALSESVDGQWLFGQLDATSKPPSSVNKIEIKQGATVTGRFSINEVFLDGVFWSKVRFIVGRP